MGFVHTLVAEVLRELVHSVESAHDEPLEIELVGDAQVQRNVQRIVVGDEWPCGRAARNALKDRCFHLETAGFIEVLAHRGDNPGSLDEHFLYLRVDDEVDVPLAVAQLRIGHGIEHLSVLFLYDRKHFERFAEQGEFLGVDAELAGLGDKRKSAYPYDVAYVEQLLPNRVVHGLVLARADLIPLDVYLHTSGFVLKLTEGCGTHYAPAHKPSGYAYLLEIAFLGIVACLDFGCVGVYGIECCRIWLNAQFPELRKGFPAQKFLFAVFHICHFLVSSKVYKSTIFMEFYQISKYLLNFVCICLRKGNVNGA